MSEHVLRVDAAELVRARFVCPGCDGAAELPVADLPKALTQGRCPFCDRAIVPPGDAGSHKDPLVRLREAIQTIALDPQRLRVEFVLPPPSPASDR